MDQCTHCTLRGDIKRCEEAECVWHELWYAKKLRGRLFDALMLLDKSRIALMKEHIEISVEIDNFIGQDLYCRCEMGTGKMGLRPGVVVDKCVRCGLKLRTY